MVIMPTAQASATIGTNNLHEIQTWMRLALCWALASGCGGDTADLVVRNAHIVAMDGRGTTAQAMAVKDGRVLALGKEQEILNAHRGARVVDVKGATVYPGLIDAHSHLLGYALGLGRLNVVGPPPTGSGGRRVQGQPWQRQGGFVAAAGTKTTGPTATSRPRSLDSLHPDTPWSCNGSTATPCWPTVRRWRRRRCGRSARCRGEVLRRPDGTPTGVLIDGAADSLLARIPKPAERKATGLGRGGAQLAGLRLTTSRTLDWIGQTSCSWIRCTKQAT